MRIEFHLLKSVAEQCELRLELGDGEVRFFAWYRSALANPGYRTRSVLPAGRLAVARNGIDVRIAI
jgi:hypothetical protein